MGWFGELIKRYGNWLLPFIFLIGITVWGITHWMAQPGKQVAILWGMITYTKRNQPEAAQADAPNARGESTAIPSREPSIEQTSHVGGSASHPPNKVRNTENPDVRELAGVQSPSRGTVSHKGKVEVMVVAYSGQPQQLAEVYVSGNEKWVGNCMPGPLSKVFEMLPDAKILSVNATVCPRGNRWVLDKWHADRGEKLVQEQYRIVVNGVTIDPTNETETTENSANYVLNLRRE